jgi:hypothetical protein
MLLTFELLLMVLFSCSKTETEIQSQSLDQSREMQNKHGTELNTSLIYYEEGRFAGWPANNGIWNWGDEILVGFVESEYLDTDGFHTYNRETARNKYARSLDGGQTWTIEDAYEQGTDRLGVSTTICRMIWPKNRLFWKKPIEDFTDPDFIITWMRYNYHNGPSIFYYSNDRGHQWHGPYRFPDLDTHGIGTRTDYLADGPQELRAFMNSAKENGREGRALHVRTTDGGVTWERVSWLGPEPQGFEIMPSTVRLSESELLTVLRVRETDPVRDYVKAYRSLDNGETWSVDTAPVNDTGHYGAPPSLVQLEDGRLAAAYAYRSMYGSRIAMRISSDNGESWSHEIPVRYGDGANADIGYPRMVQREDGKLVIVYYWNHALKEDATPYRYIAASIVDPDWYMD